MAGTAMARSRQKRSRARPPTRCGERVTLLSPWSDTRPWPERPWPWRCRLGELPERVGEAQRVEDRLVLLSGSRAPVGGEAISPPCVGELAHLFRGDRGSRLAASQPPLDVLFRPKEVHRASGEDDVVPPVRRRDEQ